MCPVSLLRKIQAMEHTSFHLRSVMNLTLLLTQRGKNSLNQRQGTINSVGLRTIGFSLTPQDAPALQAGLLCQAWENWQPKEDLFRVSKTSCSPLSPGEESDGALPAYERYVCGYFNRGVYKKAVVLRFLVNTTAGFPWKIHDLCPSEQKTHHV